MARASSTFGKREVGKFQDPNPLVNWLRSCPKTAEVEMQRLPLRSRRGRKEKRVVLNGVQENGVLEQRRNRGEEAEEDEMEVDDLTCYVAEHLLVGDDPGVEEARYDCYCGEGFDTRREYREHLEEINYEQVKRWAENLDEETKARTIGEGMKPVLAVCEKMRAQRSMENGRLTEEVQALKQQLENKEAEVKALTKKLDENVADNGKLNRKLDEKDEEINKLKMLLKFQPSANGAGATVVNEQEEIARKDKEIEHLQEKLASAQGDLKTCLKVKNMEIQDLKRDRDVSIYRKDQEIQWLKKELLESGK